MANIKGEAIFLVESWARGDKITSTRSTMLPNSQSLLALRRTSNTSRLAWSYSEVRVEGDVLDDESDVAVGEID